MNAVELLLLGRTLLKIGEEALPREAIGAYSTSVRTVLIVISDVRGYPGSAVGEIAARTGLPQSAVSAAVARLREAGAVVTEPDPRDRRRVLIQPAPEVSNAMNEIGATPIAPALAAALDTDDPQRAAEVVALLEKLARHLTPQALTRLRG